MAKRGPSHAVLGLLLAAACALGAAAACSGDAESAASNDDGNSGGSSGSSGSGGSGGSGANEGGLLDPDAFADAAQVLSVEPATATLTITDKTASVTQDFDAVVSGNPVQAVWQLSTYDMGGIAGDGLFTSSGFVGGDITVTATYGAQKATATLTVMIQISENVLDDPATDPGPSPVNLPPLQGAPQPDPGPDATKLLYPYDQTVFPRGLIAPLVQFSAGTVVPEDVLVSLTAKNFSWNGYYHLKNPAVPQFPPPQDVWDAALLTASGSTLDLSVTKAAGGVAYGPVQETLKIAPGTLKGAVYYQTYEAPLNGLYVVRPGDQQPATQLRSGCTVCHSVSANGKRLSTGAEVNDPNPAASGVYNVDLSYTITQLTGVPAGLGGDTRGLAFGVWTPDGKWVTRSINDFWGGPNQSAWKVDDATSTLIPATVNGLGAGVDAMLPAFSPDGKYYAFTNGPEDSPAVGSPSRSISVMDVVTDEATGPGGTLTFSNRKVALDNGAAGNVAKYVTFLPDSNQIVLQEGGAWYGGYDGMLPSYDGAAYGMTDGRLYLIDVAGATNVELTKANTGNVPTDQTHNYEPFALPAQAASYFWVVFTSIREYGNTYQGAAVRKQFWVTAITPGATAGTDASNPPFFLPNQSATKNERGFWALEPCQEEGQTCESQDDCCRGICQPSDPTDPNSPKVCAPPEDDCIPTDDGTCTSDADCCEVDTGVYCNNGFCSRPIPQ